MSGPPDRIAVVMPEQAWMTAPETRAVVTALTAGGGEIRFVGGCVRDALAGRSVVDVDIATPMYPELVRILAEDAGLRAVPTGIEHGTVTVVAGGRGFEVTTLRRDVETFGRHARVAFTEDWVADAARRDFTMNALSCDLERRVHDPFGGVDDLKAGRVRFVGDARARIEEDVLRLLRFFRFHAWYGHGDPDPEGLAASVAMAPRLADLSQERVRTELLRLLAAPDPVATVTVMARHEVFAPILPTPPRPEALARLVRIETGLDLEAAALRRLAVLTRADRAQMTGLAQALRMSRADQHRLERLAHPHPDLGTTGPAMRQSLHRIADVGLYVDLALVEAAESEDETPPLDLLNRRLAEAATWTPKRLPVRGADVRALGVPPGPEVGRLLGELEKWWLERDFAPDRETLLAELHRRAPGDEG